jgi:hypothetical protein
MVLAKSTPIGRALPVEIGMIKGQDADKLKP